MIHLHIGHYTTISNYGYEDSLWEWKNVNLTLGYKVEHGTEYFICKYIKDVFLKSWKKYTKMLIWLY